ncbi:MAG: hypothetical protein P9M03_11480 [Candidatus Theseobacter exili]|nr:hypothetical protein [Candidatus Theseobacter exili]
MIPIDRTEIEAWGKRQETKGEFPLLISKLIFETTPRSTFFEIPSGSAVFIDGWDGIVGCNEETGFVPKGTSLWEFKTNGGKTEADSDYDKRKEDSLGFDKSDSTFIFVTTKIWKGKNKWIDEKKKEKIWGDVRVYDSINLQNWLGITDVASKWFLGAILGRSYDNCLTVEDFWEEWSAGPNIKLVHEVVTAGRKNEIQQLKEFLNGEPNLMAVRASTKDEAIAFIIASTFQIGGQFKEQFYSKSLILENLSDFRVIKKNNSSLNLITKFEDTKALYSAVVRNHHVLLPLGPDDPYNSKDIIEPPKPDRDGQVNALIESGLSKEDASRFSREAGRDLTILKKLLGFPLSKAKWEYQKEVQELIPALLIGRWVETKDGDREVLEKLSGESYDTYSEKLYKWLEVESPPLIKIGESWRLTSPLDAWTNLSTHISVKDFDNLKECYLNVMSEISPVFELEPDQRSMASIRGKESEYSRWCREGLTQSLILIGLHGDKLKFQHSFSAQDWVDAIINELLHEATGNLWASRNTEMPLIAEASPKSFFESAYHSLSLDDMPIMDMFIEEDSWISPTSRHTGLLWALEGLAWTEEYLSDASMILARLATLDPGGNFTNRPLNSLMEIYKPWHYQTLASFEDRMTILEEIVKKEYETGWVLLSSMISKGLGTAFPTHKFRWRLFERSFDQKYMRGEIFDTHSRVIDMLIHYYDYSEDKLVVLLENSESKQLKHSDRSRVLTFIESKLDKISFKDNSAWNKLRGTLSQHRSNPDANWALPESELKRYETLYKHLEPSDPIEKVLWMFNDHWPTFPEGLEKKELSFREQEEIVMKRRIEGLKTLYQNFGFEKVKALAHSAKETWVYGNTLAHIIDKDEEILSLCEYLKEEEGSVLQFIQQFIFRKSQINTINWVFDLYEKLIERDYTDTQLARIFIQVEQSKRVWDFIDKTSSETQKSFWKGMYPNFWKISIENMIFGIDKLMEAKRFISALDICYHNVEKLPTDKLVEVLQKAGTQKSNEDRRFDSHHVTEIFEEIEKRKDIDKSVLIQIEWLYLPFLASYGSLHKPNLLHEELANNPQFFIDVLKWVYKSDKDEDETEVISDEERRNRGRNAYELLHSWKQIPGVDESGNIDEDFLWKWIKKVREVADEEGRLKVADMHIGQVMAEYPENIEPWPPKEICKVIESINTKSLKSGFSSATFNKRGSSTRGPFDGGDIERGHAKYFQSQVEKIKYEFPATADILNRLAKGYVEDAKRMDESAERDKLDY